MEGWQGQRPFDTYIIGRVGPDNREVGIPLIMDLCEKHGVKATFFVDVFGYRIHGEEKMTDIVRGIVARGHDVQLHTHPAWDFSHLDNKSFGRQTYSYGVHSPRKLFMRNYGLEQQIAMLREGIEKLAEWTGERPVAHRAGGYGANYDTLAAVGKVGIFIDASMFWDHPEWCHLNDPVLTKNKVVAYRHQTGVVL